MAYNSNWKIEDILHLIFLPESNSKLVKEAINNYNSLSELQESNLSEKLSLTFQQNIYTIDEKEKYSIKINKILESCNKKNYKIITLWDDAYPKLLKEITYPPVILYINGELYNEKMSFAIVGKRACTDYGKVCAEEFTKYFVKNDIIVVSGLANGIDTYAHQSAIDNGGITYAVIASGLDCILPEVKNSLAENIIEKGGAIISEFPPGVKAMPAYFLQRNRIISGLSKAVIVVESDVRGGSLNTAHFAFDQSREVFAIPGNINSNESRGTNLLIKKNLATIAISPEQVCEELGFTSEMNTNSLFESKEAEITFTNDNQAKIYKTISKTPFHIDEIAFNSNVEMPDVLVLLLDLEFKGLIKQLPGKHYVKI